jgi:hypothetical protein
LIVYSIKDRKNVSALIQSVVRKKINDFSNNSNKIKEKAKNKNIKNKIIIKKKKKPLVINKQIKKDNKGNIKKKNRNLRTVNGPPKKIKIIKKRNSMEFKFGKRSSISSTKNNLIKSNKKKLGININITSINNTNCKKKLIKRNSLVTSKKGKLKKNTQLSQNFKTEKNLKTTSPTLINKNSLHLNNFNDEELNTLDYEIALICDKRSYFQYYWSLLKKKQLILFTFIPSNDYNLLTLKISLFLLSFSLYFTINGFFFSDETMHKIHENNGDFNLFVQIPQILYSTVVSSIINMILKKLSLSEKNILMIKQEKNINLVIKRSKLVEKCINIKFIIFFIISSIFLLFFWYFISCFCAVYTNTQIILIKDTLFSFGLSMAYPFGLNLLPGFFRLPALRAKNKNKKCLYKISRLVAFI